MKTQVYVDSEIIFNLNIMPSYQDNDERTNIEEFNLIIPPPPDFMDVEMSNINENQDDSFGQGNLHNLTLYFNMIYFVVYVMLM